MKWLFLLILMFLPTLAVAETPATPAPRVDDVAVIVGVGDYAFLPDISGVTTTVRDWTAYLESQGVGTILTLSDSDATKERIEEFTRRATKLAGSNSRIWWVFVGHGGTTTSGDPVFVGVDGQRSFDSFQSRGVLRTTVVSLLEAGPQSETVMVLDACFSGRSRTGGVLIENAQPVVVVKKTTSDRIATFSASGANEIAGPLPGIARPAFSYLFLEALKGQGDDGDGIVTAEELVKNVTKALYQLPDRTQTPEYSGPVSFVLATGVRRLQTETKKLVEVPATAKATPVVGSGDVYEPSRSLPKRLPHIAPLPIFIHIDAGAAFSSSLAVDETQFSVAGRVSLGYRNDLTDNWRFGVGPTFGLYNAPYAAAVEEENRRIIANELETDGELSSRSRFIVYGHLMASTAYTPLPYFGEFELRVSAGLNASEVCTVWSVDGSCEENENQPTLGTGLGVSYINGLFRANVDGMYDINQEIITTILTIGIAFDTITI